jgi:hypothetical protein
MIAHGARGDLAPPVDGMARKLWPAFALMCLADGSRRRIESQNQALVSKWAWRCCEALSLSVDLALRHAF